MAISLPEEMQDSRVISSAFYSAQKGDITITGGRGNPIAIALDAVGFDSNSPVMRAGIEALEKIAGLEPHPVTSMPKIGAASEVHNDAVTLAAVAADISNKGRGGLV